MFYNGEPAFISFVQKGSDFNLNFDQINFVVPDTDALGPVSIEVETASGRSAPVMVMNQALSPTFIPFRPLDRVPQALAAVHAAVVELERIVRAVEPEVTALAVDLPSPATP